MPVQPVDFHKPAERGKRGIPESIFEGDDHVPGPDLQSQKSGGAGVAGRRLPIVLRPSRVKSVLLLLISAVFVVGGIGMISSGDGGDRFGGIACLVIFGLCSLVFGVQLLPGSSYLRLEMSGFTMCSLFRKYFYSWGEIDGAFFVTRIGTRRMVSFNFGPVHPTSKGLRKVNRTIAGADGALPDSYGKKVDALAALMNDWLANWRSGKSS